MRNRRRLLAATLVACLLPVASATADIAGPDETIGQAFGPLVAGTLYSGGFASATDVDYLVFDIAKPGESLHFDVANTVQRCSSPPLGGCPVYATLIDGQGRQLGGEGSSAGTGPVTQDASDVIDWTFDVPGRYYVAVDSDGDLPTYTLEYRALVPAVSGTPAGGGGVPGTTSTGAPASGRVRGRPITSVRVSLLRHGAVLRARLNVGRALRDLTLRLEHAGAGPKSAAVAVEHLGSVDAGRRSVTLRLDAGARRALVRGGLLAAQLRVVAVPVVGATQTVLRPAHALRR